MKKLFFSLTAMMIAVVGFAQNTLVATLTHGDDIKMFYGAFALRDAHNAAANGDVINLSGGGFQATTITKAITFRGTGVEDANPTYITGDFDINIPESVTDRLSFEGCRITNTITVKGTLKNPYFIKSIVKSLRIYRVSSASTDRMENGVFANCQILDTSLYGKSTVQFLNSHVEDFYNYAQSTATASFINCVIKASNGSSGEYIRNSNLVNSILYWTGCTLYSTDACIHSTSSAINCVAIGYGDHKQDAFRNLQAQQNCKYAGLDIFQNSNVWNDLTAEAKAKYLGNDGTPVGMFGGILPYNMTPSYPQITKMNVANKTTADGKLSVEIEVSAAK